MSLARVGCMAAVALWLAMVPTADAASLRLDGRFGEGGIARVRFGLALDQADTYPLRPVRQPDGKLLVAAARDEFHGYSQILLARFTARGRPDPTFGHGGRERLGVHWNFRPSAVHVLPDGRIVVMGAAGYGAPGGLYPAPGQIGLVRLLSDGSRDRSFGTNGFVTWNPPPRAESTYHYALPGLFIPQADGEVLAAGVATAQVNHLDVRRAVFVRFNADGSVDNSFGHAGLSEGPESPAYSWAWAALPDGDLVALTERNDESGTPAWSLDRFTSEGALDTAFGQNGSMRLGPSALKSVSELLPERDGSLLVLGVVDPAHPAGSAAAARRIEPSGQLDARYGTACPRSGPRTYSWAGGAPTSDGGIFGTARGFVGHALGHARIDSFVFRYSPDGCLAGRPLRVRAASVGPPLLQRRRIAIVGAAYNHRLALIRIRR